MLAPLVSTKTCIEFSPSLPTTLLERSTFECTVMVDELLHPLLPSCHRDVVGERGERNAFASLPFLRADEAAQTKTRYATLGVA
jgi:hypothetical protein